MSQKHFFILLVLLCCKLSASTQTSNSFKADDYDIAKCKIKKISIAQPLGNIRFTNIANIEVLDARADTTAVGFMQKNTRKPIFVASNNSLKYEAQQFVNSYCNYNKNESKPI